MITNTASTTTYCIPTLSATTVSILHDCLFLCSTAAWNIGDRSKILFYSIIYENERSFVSAKNIMDNSCLHLQWQRVRENDRCQLLQAVFCFFGAQFSFVSEKHPAKIIWVDTRHHGSSAQTKEKKDTTRGVALAVSRSMKKRERLYQKHLNGR